MTESPAELTISDEPKHLPEELPPTLNGLSRGAHRQVHSSHQERIPPPIDPPPTPPRLRPSPSPLNPATSPTRNPNASSNANAFSSKTLSLGDEDIMDSETLERGPVEIENQSAMDGANQSQFLQVRVSSDEIASAAKQGIGNDRMIDGGDSGFAADFGEGSGVEGEVDSPVREVDLGALLELKKKQLLGEIELVEGECSNVSLNGSAPSVDAEVEKSCGDVKGLELNGGGNVGNGIDVIDETDLVESVSVLSNGSAQCVDAEVEKNCRDLKGLELNGGGNVGNLNEVIDGTDSLESASVLSNGSEIGFVGSVEGIMWNGPRDTRREVDGNKVKRRRKGKSRKKVLQENESCNYIHMTGSKGDGPNIMYSRGEIEALRFVKIVDQQRLWEEVYNGLGPDVAKEYDDLGSAKHKKQFGLEFDPRQQFAKKELGGNTPENIDNDLESVKHNGIDHADTLDSACSEMVGCEDGYTDLEEECVEDSDSEEDYASIQKPAFMVDGDPDFDSGPVEDGFEYLRRVRWEAAHIPKVKVAKLDRSKLNKEQSVYMPQIEDIAKCPEHLLPLKQWEEAFLEEFSELRLALSHLEDSDVKTSGTSRPDDTILETDEPLSPSNSNSNPNPKLSTILGLEPVARVSSLRKRIRAMESTTALSREDGLWLFALCAAIETPLDADTCAALRSLLRKCARLRSEKSERDDELVMLNILISVSGRFFGQLE